MSLSAAVRWLENDQLLRKERQMQDPVSKAQPVEQLLAAYRAGVRRFGENRSDELAEKAAAMAHLPDVQWHFIGQLQSRQAREVARHAHCFHAVDRIKIAERMQQALEAEGRELPVYVQVNVSGEESKGGFACAAWRDDAAQLSAFLDAVRLITSMLRLKMRGLMTMAPFQGLPLSEPERLFLGWVFAVPRAGRTLRAVQPRLPG